MIHYTDALSRLIADIVARVEPLSFIETEKVLVFARFGRSGTPGAYATCHSLNLPTSEPGYYYWRDRRTGRLTRRSEWFVTRTPEVWIGERRLDYMLSFVVPRFCDQTLEGTRKAAHYEGFEPWVAKLDTVVHELYHIAPGETGLRRLDRAGGRGAGRCHSPEFFEAVARFVRQYLDSGPDPALTDFLRYDFASLVRRHGGVIGTTFRNFPSYPQRYREPLGAEPGTAGVMIVPIRPSRQPRRYTERDLVPRLFTADGARRLLAGRPPRRASTAA
jgi:hypothetical protein